MSVTSVQRAHDELLKAMPSGASHDACPLCHPGAGDSEKAKEAEVADERTFTQTEHFALLTDAVQRETAALAEVKEDLEGQITSLQSEKAELTSSVTDLQARIDVLDAEKAAAEQARDAATAEFEAFKAELAEKAAVEARKADRVARVKAANAALSEEYFTEARADRWAQMADETFEALVADITEAAAAAPAKAETAGAEAPRETAAFTGGTTPSAGSGSLFGQFLTATGHGPKPVNA